MVIMPVGAGRRPSGGNVGHEVDQRGIVNIEGSSTRDGRTFLLLGPLVFFSVFCWSLGCSCLRCRCRCCRVSHLSQRSLCCVDRSIVCCCRISVVGRAAIVERSSFRRFPFSGDDDQSLFGEKTRLSRSVSLVRLRIEQKTTIIKP